MNPILQGTKDMWRFRGGFGGPAVSSGALCRYRESLGLGYSIGVLELFTGLLVVVGIITAVVIGWQSWETRKSAEAARQSIFLTHRPKLVVRNVVVPPLEIMHRQTSMQDLLKADDLGRFEGYFQLANMGNTDATIESISDRILIGDRLPMERQYTNSNLTRIRLRAGESQQVRFTPLNAPVETQLAILNARTEVYVMGLITYTDGLGIRRETAFCQRLDRELHRLVPVADQDYEYSD